jgi:hypothetical protein
MMIKEKISPKELLGKMDNPATPGTAGQVLTSDGTDYSWDDIPKDGSKLDQSSIAPEWSAGAHTLGTHVTHKGKYWKALADTSDEPTVLSADWTLEDDIDAQIVAIKALIGTSDISKYGADVKAAIVEIASNVIADGAGAHNAIYRGKFLGTSVTAEQYASIADGTFKDLFIGDYWIINGVTWRIAAFDYWYNVAGDNIDVHHVVIVPDEALTTCQMNSTNITTGGYVGSDFYTGANGNTGRATAISAVNSAFGAAHILHYNDYLINAVTDGHPSGQVWQECTVELMNEPMVYGGKFFEPMANGTTVYSNYTVSKSQLPLFQHDHSRICNRASWWLRGVVSAAAFAIVNGLGDANNGGASDSRGVRPAFAIRA